jgi:thioredoxin reductase (NADPH)
MTTQYDLIVVGEGFAGLTCAGEAAKLGLKVASFEAEFFGGLVLNVNTLQRFDEADGLSGMDRAAILAKENAKLGVKSNNARVSAVRRAGDIFEVVTDAGAHTARAVVLASGARLKKLGVRGEEDFDGRGVSHCADCDGPMFSGARVAVAGGNDWAIHEAAVLAQDAARVYLVHEGERPTASVTSIEHLRDEPKIECIPNATIEEIVGNDAGVTGVRVRGSGGALQELECEGVFPFIGLEPNGEIAPEEVLRDDAGAVQVDERLQTALPGLFAIGTVRSGFGGWLADAVSDARQAARNAKAGLA